MLHTYKHFHPCLTFTREAPLYSKDRLIALPLNVRLGWKCVAIKSDVTVLITGVKSFMVKAP
jgi:hypothetical protein